MSGDTSTFINLPLFDLETVTSGIQDFPLFGIFLCFAVIFCSYLAGQVTNIVTSHVTNKVRNKVTIQHTSREEHEKESIADFSFYLTISIVGLISARCGYFFLYFSDYLLIRPSVLFDINAGGFSLYSGIIGGALFLFYKQKKHHMNALFCADSIALVLPVGIAMMAACSILFEKGSYGGNVGTSSELIWAASYQFDGGSELRHPIALYNIIFAGVLLFAVLQFLQKYTKQLGVIAGSFLVLFGLYSFIIQFITQQSPEYEPRFWFISIKQLIDLCAIFAGLYVLHWGYINNAKVLISGKKICEPI